MCKEDVKSILYCLKEKVEILLLKYEREEILCELYLADIQRLLEILENCEEDA